MRPAFLLLYLPPSSAKSVSAEEFDGPFCADGPNLTGAGANAQTEAWDCSIPSDSRGDTVAQRCVKNALQVVHTGGRTRYIERRGGSALDTALSKDHAATHWAAKLSPGSDHYIVLLGALIGVDDAPVAVPRPDRTLLKWKEADWNKHREVTNQLRRIPRELTSTDSTGRHATSEIQNAVTATVPARKRQPSPFWTSGLAGLDRTTCRTL
ncbi:reverse transcriptase (RNA-dependent DNA polymerase) [Trypanosoma cruzi]|uniref:Reverse transcriptase (RNA-dependent DNA polymerase) n=1 Tax=Trypanosoma cruzi TaxID=5693 RepID=A0A2V2WHP6_TRYCR|nr:reverse transcriptase (RNA-dependent DNA polymerase) [Trypanosoma cruzi]